MAWPARRSAAKPQTPVPCSSPPLPGALRSSPPTPQIPPCPPPEPRPHSRLSPPASLGSDVTFLASPSLKPSRPLILQAPGRGTTLSTVPQGGCRPLRHPYSRTFATSFWSSRSCSTFEASRLVAAGEVLLLKTKQREPGAALPPHALPGRGPDAGRTKVGSTGAAGSPGPARRLLRQEGREMALGQGKSRRMPSRFSKACLGRRHCLLLWSSRRPQTPRWAGLRVGSGRAGLQAPGLDFHCLRASLYKCTFAALTPHGCPLTTQGHQRALVLEANVITAMPRKQLSSPICKLKGICLCPHFADEKTEPQGGAMTCTRPPAGRRSVSPAAELPDLRIRSS